VIFRLGLIACLTGTVLLSAAATRAAEPAKTAQALPVASDVRVGGDDKATRFVLDLTQKVDIAAFTLADPYRVVIDLPQIAFKLPANAGEQARGLIKAFRYGLVMKGGSRIVIDVKSPVRVDKAFTLPAADNMPARLVLELSPTDRDSFLRTIALADHTRRAAPSNHNWPAPASDNDPRPLIVLDPGHGGIDPGTSSADGVTEKDVVLAFAKSLKAKLEATGRYEVYLTREDDTFLPLRERVEFAQKKGAGLFLSIHADYFPEQTEKATGATVYTLSEQASDEEAKELATKENFSDAIAGVALPSDSDEVVANILIDLAQRETQNRSTVFARSIVGELAGNLHTHKMRSAGFRVLKAPDIPSVLIEIGFLSNPDDEKHLVSDAWRDRISVSLVDAIDGYFAKRIARAPF